MCLAVLRYATGGKLFLLQSAFDEELDDYPARYCVYYLPETVENELEAGSWKFLERIDTRCLGTVAISDVSFDVSGRKKLDALILDPFVDC